MYRGGVELAYKSRFSRGEKHRQECIQACNSTNDPINRIKLSNSSLTTIFKHMDLKKKTHTHTHTKQV